MKVLGFSGRARHGKDTCAEIARRVALEEFGKRLVPWSFALPLKATVYGEGAGNYSIEDVFYNKPAHLRKRLQLRGTEEGRDVFGDSLWTLQAEAYLHIFSDPAFGIDGVTFADVRFPNEVTFCRSGGKDLDALAIRKIMEWAEENSHLEDPDDPAELAKLLDIEERLVDTVWADLLKELESPDGMALYITSDRPTLTGEAAKHASEISLDHLDKKEAFDGIIVNNQDTTFDDLADQIRPYVKTLFEL